MPVIEAMSFEKSVFYSPDHHNRKLVAKAFYFENFDATNMQRTFEAGMKKYTNDNMKQSIKDRANLFTWQNTARSYLKLYEELLVN